MVLGTLGWGLKRRGCGCGPIEEDAGQKWRPVCWGGAAKKAVHGEALASHCFAASGHLEERSSLKASPEGSLEDQEQHCRGTTL